MRLVHNLCCLGADGIFMPGPVVTAKQQIGPAGEDDADIGLGSTTIAAIGCA
jgi:hypothetical protein